MRKVVKSLAVAALSAVVAVSATAAVSAAGINAAEQSILDELNTTIVMNGVEKRVQPQYVNQAENYFNTIEVTDEQAEQIIAKIDEIKTFLQGTSATKIAELTSEEADTVAELAQEALSVINLTLQYTKSTGAVSIVDADGTVVFSATVAAISGDADNPIKVTGFGFNIPGIAAVGGVGIVLVSAAGIYLIKTGRNKEKIGNATA